MDAEKNSEQNEEDTDQEVNQEADEEEKTHNTNQFTAECIKNMKTAIDEMVKARRRSKDSQEEIAAKLGVTVDYIGKIEQNRSKLPAYVMQKYCQEYDLSADDLFGLARGDDSNDIDKIKSVIDRLPEPYLKAIKDIIDLYHRNILNEHKE